MIDRTCPVCGSLFRVKNQSARKATCSKSCAVSLRKKTFVEVYGTDNPMRLESVKKKIEENNLKKHGTKSHLSSSAVKEKRRKTNLEKYGTDNPSKSVEIKSKIRTTFVDRYGVENPMHLSASVDKLKSTNVERYGVESYTQTTEYREKTRQTNLERLGVEHSLQSPSVRLKSRQTNLERYGHESHMQNAGVREKLRTTNLRKYGVDNFSKTCEFKESQSGRNIARTESVNENFKILRDREQLIYKLLAGKSVAELSLELGVNSTTIYRYIEKFDIDLFSRVRSSYETSIVEYIRSLGISNIATNERGIIPPRELDIYLPDHNMAIEINGTYWHSDKFCDKEYHYSKFKSCQDRGIRLLSIYTHRYDNNPDIYKSKIRHMLGVGGQRVFARRCTVKEVDATSARSFLDSNHIQGYTSSTLSYGLYHENTLVALMTFSKTRKGIGKDRGDNSYELVRYATSCPVVGGASRLFAHFKTKVRPGLVVSYSDNTYSVGNLYNRLGFTLEKDSKVDYFYVKNNIEYHRFNFAKYKLIKQGYDSTKTEKEIMEDRGFLRVWGCGTKTWVWKQTAAD